MSCDLFISIALWFIVIKITRLRVKYVKILKCSKCWKNTVNLLDKMCILKKGTPFMKEFSTKPPIVMTWNSSNKTRKTAEIFHHD